MLSIDTWRTIFAGLLDDPIQYKQLAHALHVRPATLLYWLQADARPHPRQLYTLMQEMPEHRKLLTIFLCDKTYPQGVVNEVVVEEIPPIFRDRFYASHSLLPPTMRVWSLCQLALQQMIGHLDPYRLGMMIKIVRCMPPSLGDKVRSMREFMGIGTAPWQHHVEHNTLFLGNNSLAGYTASTGHCVVSDRFPPACEKQSIEDVGSEYEASAVAIPLTRNGTIFGCLYLTSVYEAYFTASHLRLIESYAELITSAFEPDDFYAPACIELWDMPARPLQMRYLATLRPRIVELMLKEQYNFTEAEQLAWQQIEHELLQVLW